MLSLASLLSWLSLQRGLVFPLVAGHEACMADGQESMKGSSLIQSVSSRYRSFVEQPSSQQAKPNSESSRLAKTGGSTDPGIAKTYQRTLTQDMYAVGNHPRNPGENATLNKMGLPQQRFVSLLQLCFPGNGAVRTIIFITAVFFLVGMVWVLVLLTKAFLMRSEQRSDTQGAAEGTRHGDTTKEPPRFEGPCLSSQLEVPEDLDCNLVIQMPPKEWRGSFSVCKLSGKAVFKVLIQDRASGSFQQVQQVLEIQLHSSATPSSSVGRCRLLDDTFRIYQKDTDHLYGTIDSEFDGKARLKMKDGGYLEFNKDDEGVISVVDKQHQLYGTGESYGPDFDSPLLKVFRPVRDGERDFYLVKVGRHEDAGVILCGIMCLHQLDGCPIPPPPLPPQLSSPRSTISSSSRTDPRSERRVKQRMQDLQNEELERQIQEDLRAMMS